MMMCDQEVQSRAFVAETSNAYCTLVEGVVVGEPVEESFIGLVTKAG